MDHCGEWDLSSVQPRRRSSEPIRPPAHLLPRNCRPQKGPMPSGNSDRHISLPSPKRRGSGLSIIALSLTRDCKPRKAKGATQT